jgi:hypothetical protein
MTSRFSGKVSVIALAIVLVAGACCLTAPAAAASDSLFFPYSQETGSASLLSGIGYGSQVSISGFLNGGYGTSAIPDTPDLFGVNAKNPFASVSSGTDSLIKGALTNYLANPDRFSVSSVTSSTTTMPDHTWDELFTSPKVTIRCGCG